MPFPECSTLLDDFNRANEGPPPSARWGADAVTNSGVRVLSNQCVNSAGTSNDASRFDGARPVKNADYFVTVAAVPTAFLGDVGIYARLNGLPGFQSCGYVVDVRTIFAGADTWAVSRVDNGIDTDIGGTATQLIAAGHKIGIRVQGTTISGWHFNGTVWTEIISRTDSTYGDGRTGLLSNDSTAALDDLSGGAIPEIHRRIVPTQRFDAGMW